VSAAIPATAPLAWRDAATSHPAIEPGLDYYGSRRSRYVYMRSPDSVYPDDPEHDCIGATVWIESDGGEHEEPYVGWLIGGMEAMEEQLVGETWIDRPTEEASE